MTHAPHYHDPARFFLIGMLVVHLNDPYYLFYFIRVLVLFFFFFSSRRRHTRFDCDWSSDVCSSDLFFSFVATSRRFFFLGVAIKVNLFVFLSLFFLFFFFFYL